MEVTVRQVNFFMKIRRRKPQSHCSVICQVEASAKSGLKGLLVLKGLTHMDGVHSSLLVRKIPQCREICISLLHPKGNI